MKFVFRLWLTFSLLYFQQAVEDYRFMKSILEVFYKSQLEQFQEQEAFIQQQLDILHDQREAVRTKKRSHVQCLVNVVACYKKRR